MSFILKKIKYKNKKYIKLFNFTIFEKEKCGIERTITILNILKFHFTSHHRPTLLNNNIMWRNDDVAYDTDITYFKKFCKIFQDLGYIQTHGITLYGTLNTKHFADGTYRHFPNIPDLSTANYNTIKEASLNYFIGNNKELIEYLNNSKDNIALHGLYHTDYSKMSYHQQEYDITTGLTILKSLFPNKEIKDFIAPFNRANKDTYKICKKLGLRVSIGEGEHLEELINHNNGTIKPGMVYRYHHQRFYPASKIYYNISLNKLQTYLKNHPIQKI